jgi:hypothetical protein
LIAVAVTLIFFDGRLDLAAARTFYSAQAEEHWPLGGVTPWSVLYRLAPWITASLALIGLGVLTLGLMRKHNALQRNAIFLLLSLALGPGLLVNGIFKDHWERPRPRDIIEFAGELPYAPAPLRGEGGKSFPCGHCSVGFLYAGGWWIWRPHGVPLATQIPLGSLSHPPVVFELTARSSNVEITIVEPSETKIVITGELHGFGLPGGQLLADARFHTETEPTLTYRIEQHGWFTDLDAAVSVRFPARELRRLVARVQHGNIKVVDATRKHVVRTGEVTLELHTSSGRVRTRTDEVRPSARLRTPQADLNEDVA